MGLIAFVKGLFSKGPVKRKYGYIRDRKDSRDKMYKDFIVDEVKVMENLPKSVDLTTKLPPCYDQGQLGSCTANAIAGAIAFIENGNMHSRLFIYYNERKMEGTVMQDAGAQIRDGIKSVASDGVCPESMWAYNPSMYWVKPWPCCYMKAKKDVVSAYLRVNGLQQQLSCLAEGFPIVAGFSVYESMETPEVAKTGIVPMPGPNDECVGGHAILIVGYDMDKKIFLVRNSWGTDWGVNGNFWVPFDYFGDSNLCTDNWTIRSATDMKLTRKLLRSKKS